MVDAALALDAQQYFTFFAQDQFVGLNADGTIWSSIDDLKKLIEPGFNAVAKVESLIFPVVQVSVIDANTAVLVNQYEQVLVLKSGQKILVAGGGAQVWSRLSGQWKLVSISASSKPTAD